MIKLTDIDKFVDSRFQRTFILKGINLDIEEGEFVTIMGPSGAGKSTLLNIIGMLDEPSQGEYFFLSEPVHKLREKKKSELHRHYLGFIFQAYHLIDELTVYENIETPLLYKGVKSSQRKSMVAEILDRQARVHPAKSRSVVPSAHAQSLTFVAHHQTKSQQFDFYVLLSEGSNCSIA